MSISKRIVLSILFVCCFSSVQGGLYSYFFPYKNVVEAIKGKDYESTKSFLENGVSVDEKDEWNKPLITIALDQGALEIVDLLVEHGASLEGKLHTASTVEIAEYLVGKGCKVDEYDANGMTPLMKVNTNVAEFLIQQGANLERKNSGGATALALTASQGDVAKCRLLIKHHADLETRDNLGMTPLSRAVDKRQVNTVKFLIRADANVNAVDNYGMTPLMHAAVRGNIATASCLLEHGADRNAMTTKYITYEEKSTGLYYTPFPRKTSIPNGSTAAAIAGIFSNGAIKELIEGS